MGQAYTPDSKSLPTRCSSSAVCFPAGRSDGAKHHRWGTGRGGPSRTAG